ncbi:AraC family transcriptional regulator [Leisingera thetidis]|uniref:AraC family transcriptional regulator n=1 Tax=Leisingera thetidis TaxID=2930199 RepID=UPI0021F7DC06|nr:AraC family transcriptional regulator [Leisingera thetidis]
MSISLLRAQRFAQVSERQASSVHEFMESISGPHQLEIYHQKELAFSYAGNAVPSANISFGYLEYGTQVSVEMGAGIEHYTVNLPLTGHQTVSHGQRKIASNPQHGILLSPKMQLQIDIDHEYRSIFVVINRGMIELALSRLIGRRTQQPLVFDIDMPMQVAATASWWRMTEHYLNEMSIEGSILSFKNAAKELELSMVRALLVHQKNNYSDEISCNLFEFMPPYMQRAVRHIEDFYQDEIPLDRLRNVAGVSADKLCAGFREYSGTTPIGYIKKTRLMKAREQLMTDTAGKGVSTIAFDVGFNHLGRFSVDYRAMFGESPSETAARTRQVRL